MGNPAALNALAAALNIGFLFFTAVICAAFAVSLAILYFRFRN